MIFTNIHTFSVVICIAIFLIGVYFLVDIYRTREIKTSSILLWIILIVLIVSLFGPRGWMKSQTQTYVGWNIVFLVDVSKSMNALDFNNQSASRLDLSKYMISEFMKWNPNNAYALDVFSWDTLKLLPFTQDQSIYQTVLSGISESSVGQPWTDISWAIATSISHFSEDTSWLIVMITDGWDDVIDGKKELQDMLKNTDVSLLIIWVGSKKWSYIPTWIDLFGRLSYKTYQWEKVITKLNSAQLKDFTSNLWTYKELDTIDDIENIFKSIDSASEKITFESDVSQRKNLVSIFVILVWFLWLLFLWNMVFPHINKK